MGTVEPVTLAPSVFSPAAAADEEPVTVYAGPRVPEDPGKAQALSDAKIMMVDDEPTTIEVIQLYLEDAGYSHFVMTSRSPQALELLGRARPDILLLDLVMPEVSGFDILSSVRSDVLGPHIPVIILTSSSDAQTKLKALELGATDFLAKPVDPSELVLRLRNNLAVKAYQDGLWREREKSERLLLNILPQPVAERLKSGERTIADQFDEATVLFADLVNFTDFASRTDAASVVERLNEVFQTFDELVAGHGLEKIKTVGDAYMLAGGIPIPREDHADAVVDAGLEMLAAIRRVDQCRDEGFALRVGAHTGPLVAGVIGKSKFNYDLWGDTVNVASRMESQGVPGQVQISEATRRALTGKFRLSARGPTVIKGKGVMETYIVHGR